MPRITPISPKKLRKFFEKEGFTCVRVAGDHYVFTKPGVPRPVVIPEWPEIPVFIIKNNLRTAGISREKYLKAIQKL